MKKLNLTIALLILCGWATMAQSPTRIPYGTKTRLTTIQPATPQPMQVTPKTGTGMVIAGTANTFTNLSNTIPMADGTNLTVTLKATPGTCCH